MGLPMQSFDRLRMWTKELPLPAARTMETVYATSISARRFNMALLGLFAGLALVLATVGIYGVISYSVIRQTHDIGSPAGAWSQPPGDLSANSSRGLNSGSNRCLIGLAGAFLATRVLRQCYMK